MLSTSLLYLGRRGEQHPQDMSVVICHSLCNEEQCKHFSSSSSESQGHDSTNQTGQVFGRNRNTDQIRSFIQFCLLKYPIQPLARLVWLYHLMTHSLSLSALYCHGLSTTVGAVSQTCPLSTEHKISQLKCSYQILIWELQPTESKWLEWCF